MKAANRVILNTAILYIQMVVNAVIALMSTRWVLEALGKEDFGIYNLVGGVIAMFSFLNVAMAAATQRFLSYSIGQNKEKVVKDTFKCSVVLHIVIGVIVLVLFEVMGAYFMHYKMQIPHGRFDEAMIVLHCLSVSTFFTILTVPYQAILNAKENMLTIAFIGIYESGVKFVIAIILLKYCGDRLVLYAFLMMSMFISSMIILRVYCLRKYHETRLDWHSKIDYVLFKKIFSFAGWNFIGSISGLIRNQGLSMLMNTFFGVLINAAYGIANQVNGQAQFFSRTIIRSLQPQIVKSEGSGDRERMIRISLTACKIPFLMLSLIVVPLIAEMPFVLRIWLGSVPENSVVFCRIILLVTLFFQIKMGLHIAIDSVGKIKWYQIVCGGLHFIVLPIAYYIYIQGYSAYYGLIIVLIEELVTIFFTTLFAKSLAGIGLKKYYLKVFFPSTLTVVALFTISSYLNRVFGNDWLHFLLFTCSYSVSLCVIGYFILLDSDERRVIKSFAQSFVNKLYKT